MTLNVDELLADTCFLSAEEFGAYILILMELGKNEAYLNAWEDTFTSERTFTEITKLNVNKWVEIKETIKSFFSISDSYWTCFEAQSENHVSFEFYSNRQRMPKSLRQKIFKRDGWFCRYCSSDEGPFHIDHIIPVSKGGTDDEDNLCVACVPCNLSKSDKTLVGLGEVLNPQIQWEGR